MSSSNENTCDSVESQTDQSKDFVEECLSGSTSSRSGSSSFPEEHLESTAYGENLGASAGDDTPGDESPKSSKPEKDTFMKWLTKSPQRLISNVTKSFKSPKSVTKLQPRPVCSSEVEIGSPSFSFQQLSPIEKPCEVKNVKPDCPTRNVGDPVSNEEKRKRSKSPEETLVRVALECHVEKQEENLDACQGKVPQSECPVEGKRAEEMSPEDRKEAHPVHIPAYISVPRVDRIDYANLTEENIIPTFLSSRTCYDVIPTSGKVVVLSLELLVKNAFEALVNNEHRAAPLWDANMSSFVGMLTISDFISVLRHYYRNATEDIKDIESQSIATWRIMTGVNQISKPVIKVNGMDNLALATKLLIEEGVHRIPVLDESRQCALFVLTRKRLLHYLYYNIVEKFGKTIMRTPSFLSKSIKELNVGTFGDIATVTFNTKVIEALDLFVQRKVSALPIVDENNMILDIFAKFDVFALAKEQTYHNLDMTIDEAIVKGKVHEDVYGCKPDDSLGSVIYTIVTSKAHRLVVTDEKKTVVGMLSLSDILKFLVVQPLIKMQEASMPAEDIIEEAAEGAVGGAETDDSVFLNPKQKSEECSDPQATPTETAEAEEGESRTKDSNSANEEE